MKKKILRTILSVILLLVLTIGKVYAAGGSASISLGSTTVTKGGTATVNVNVSSLTGAQNDKIVSFGGYLVYDSEYLTYTGINGANGFSLVDINPDNNNKFYFMTTGSGIGSGKMGNFTFTTKKSGTTTVSVTTPSGTDKSSNLTVTVASATITINDPAPVLDSNSKLSDLKVNGTTVSGFSGNTKNYTVTVPRDTTSVELAATAASSKAKSVSGTGTKDITDESQTFTIRCTAENNSYTDYTVTIKKEAKQPDPEPEPEPEKKSSDSSLKSLSVSGYKLSPSFKSGTKEYSMTVANGITGLAVTAVPNDPKATYEISGNKDWAVGKNTISIKVTAEDGSSTTYKVYVTRENAKTKSSDKNVDFKIKSPHTITPDFSNGKNEYDVTVPYDVKDLDLEVIPYDKNAKVSISGEKDLSSEKLNKVTIKVTAEDGSVRTITLNVTRSEYKANTDLLDLKVKDYTMSPNFKASITKYSVTVPYKVKDVTVLVKAPKDATYKITGNKNLQVGKNTVLVKVMDKKGFTKYYQIDVTRKKGFNFFGLGLIPFLIILFLLLILLLLLLLLLRRRKEKKRRKAMLAAANNEEDNDTVKQDSPVHIDFKPEFNFNSKNGTDDDTVYGGDYVSGKESSKLIEKDDNDRVIDAEYDPYDATVTKDELVDALNEGIRTKNVDKLQMLLDQENLNRRKRKLKRKEEEKADLDSEDEDDYEPEHSYEDNDEE